jgi:hypothetical protein
LSAHLEDRSPQSLTPLCLTVDWSEDQGWEILSEE